ncbi:MAG TPA: hypothetical protein VEQ10_01695 [Vicinamibacteria bacterium]|nr:hypothetical protein [Vicinamibacteria bacterium]
MPQLLVAHAAKVVLLALLAGILWRGRARLCWSFVLYVVALLVGNAVVSLWPSRFWTPSAWLLKQWIYDALKMAVVAELAWRAFRRFPGAARTGQAIILALLVPSTLALAPLGLAHPYAAAWEWQAHVATALWLLAAAALIVVWHQTPSAQWWQRAIIMGLAPLLVYAGLFALLLPQGWALSRSVAVVEAFVSLGLFIFWTWAAWRGETARAGLTPAS